MNKKVIVGSFLVLMVTGIVSWNFQSQETPDLVDTTFQNSILYTCAEGNSFRAEFDSRFARVALENGTYTLELQESSSGATYANAGDQVVLMIKDFGGSVKEGGKTTHHDCITTPPGAEVTRAGVVVEVNKDQALFDGPIRLVIRAKNGMLTTVAVPSMGLPMCVAHKKGLIKDPYIINVGEEVEVAGIITEEGFVVPCDSEAHYLR